jgi:hypothetical protein
MTRQEQLDKSTFLQVPTEIAKVDFTAGVIYGQLLFLSHGQNELIITYREIADYWGKTIQWARKHIRTLEKIGAIQVEYLAGKGLHITLTPIRSYTPMQTHTPMQSYTPMQTHRTPLYERIGHPYTNAYDTPIQTHRGHPQQTQSTTGKNGPLIIEEKNNKKNIYDVYIDSQKTEEKPVNFFEKPITDPVVEVIKAYNEEYARPLGRKEAPLRVSQSRKQKIKHLLKSYTVEDFRKVFQIARENPFLRGDKGKWHFTLSWLLKSEENMDKILEGYYDEKRPQKGKSIHNYDTDEELIKHDEEYLLSTLGEIDAEIEHLGEDIIGKEEM